MKSIDIVLLACLPSVVGATKVTDRLEDRLTKPEFVDVQARPSSIKETNCDDAEKVSDS